MNTFWFILGVRLGKILANKECSHKWAEDETIENCRVELLKCSKCGEYSIGWSRNGYRKTETS